MSPVFFLLGVVTGLAVFSFALHRVYTLGIPKKKLSAVSKKVKSSLSLVKKPAGAKNAAAVLNASVDFQKVKTAEIEIPVIAADVLSYEPGELGEAYPDWTRLYYAPEALKDPEYLQTVLRSPIQVGTHELNTGEHNIQVNGWPTEAVWDEDEQRVKVKGVLHGEENVKYAAANKNKPNFGTSAFISFLEIERTAGTSPDGKPYDAIVKKAVNNHIAILPNVRDPKNIILAMNAVKPEELENAGEEKTKNSKYDDMSLESLKRLVKEEFEKRNDPQGIFGDIFPNFDARPAIKSALKSYIKELKDRKDAKNTEGRKMPFDKEDFKNAMNEYEEGKKKEEEEKNALKNAVLDELKGDDKEGKNAEEEKKKEEADNAAKAANAAEEEKKKEEADNAAKAANALPSEAMVKDFSDALGITFKTTPTLSELAAVAGVNGKDAAELITALNAKRETFSVSAKNEKTETDSVKTVNDLIRSF